MRQSSWGRAFNRPADVSHLVVQLGVRFRSKSVVAFDSSLHPRLVSFGPLPSPSFHQTHHLISMKVRRKPWHYSAGNDGARYGLHVSAPHSTSYQRLAKVASSFPLGETGGYSKSQSGS
jgi:hypothetical protein